jgi:ribosome-associated toxin RatA of RatAB toxin-antitoxin module
MAKAQRTIDVAVPPEAFFGMLQDYARYPEFLPDVKSVRVGPRAGDSVEVTYRLDAKVKTIEFTLLHVEKPPLRVDWKLLRGDLIRRDEGTWTLERTPQGGTRATYAIEMSFAAPFGAALERALAEQGLPGLLLRFKQRAEQLHRAAP